MWLSFVQGTTSHRKWTLLALFQHYSKYCDSNERKKIYRESKKICLFTALRHIQPPHEYVAVQPLLGKFVKRRSSRKAVESTMGQLPNSLYKVFVQKKRDGNIYIDLYLSISICLYKNFMKCALQLPRAASELDQFQWIGSRWFQWSFNDTTIRPRSKCGIQYQV